MASKRKSLCIDEKVLLIRAIETGEKISDVGKRFGFSRSTVSTIWKNKEKILQAEGEGKSSKKIKKPKYEDLDQAILSWFHRQRQNNMPISGPLVKAKAENFAEELGITSFKASEGWLGKFKQRHHINYGKISGEARTWEEVTPTTIQHSFRHAGLCTNSTIDEVETEPEFDSDDDLPLTEWIQQVNMTGNTVNFQTYIEVDDCLLTTTSLTDIEILDSVRKTEDQEQGDEEDETDELEPPPNIKEALKAAKLLENYFFYHQDASISQDMNKIIKKIQRNYWCSKRRQTKITDYTQ
ncbi:hypothetical protein O0L34_g5290 [Tuta absoluta]|nr:hypothetical protein O0L34_g18854 [Tuta absoluta]KAJ2950920.1 hypothetical protein O0L34_g5290 [Tuta absoluta]